jgi:hypothetical protein
MLPFWQQNHVCYMIIAPMFSHFATFSGVCLLMFAVRQFLQRLLPNWPSCSHVDPLLGHVGPMLGPCGTQKTEYSSANTPPAKAYLAVLVPLLTINTRLQVMPWRLWCGRISHTGGVRRHAKHNGDSSGLKRPQDVPRVP